MTNWRVADVRHLAVIVAVAMAMTIDASPGLAQDTTPRWPFVLPALDMSIAASATQGVQLYAAASILTAQGRKEGSLIEMEILPDSVLEWVNAASTLTHLDRSPGSEDGIVWGRPLLSQSRKRYMAIGVDVEGAKVGERRFLGLVDGKEALKFELKRAEADSLIKLMFVAATQAAWVPFTARYARDSFPIAFPSDSMLDQPTVPLSHPKVQWQGREGRVYVRYIVGVDGAVEPASIKVVLSTHPALEAEARRVISLSRFAPARFRGQPVRQLVQQVVAFKYDR